MLLSNSAKVDSPLNALNLALLASSMTPITLADFSGGGSTILDALNIPMFGAGGGGGGIPS